MKGDKTNKAIELLFELSLRDDFRNDVKQARIALRIPKNGIKTKDEMNKWKMDKSNVFLFFGIMLDLMKKYSIPHAYYVPLQEYIETNKLETKTSQFDFVGIIDRYAHRKDIDQGYIEDWYTEQGQPFVKLILLGNNRKSDVIKFIEKNWPQIESILVEQGDIKKHTREKIYKKRDGIIVKLSKKTLAQLRIMLPKDYDGPNYKDFLIQEIMWKKGYRVRNGYIRKIIDKYKA